MINGGDQKVWVSALNDPARIAPNSSRKGPVRFYDTTLRDGEQTVGVALDPQQKLEIARQLDSLGTAGLKRGFREYLLMMQKLSAWSAELDSAPRFGDSPAPCKPISMK
ncbi:MAG TPA: hypothetical protein VIH76_15395 [Candidatus Acidoferrales bacterium]